MWEYKTIDIISSKETIDTKLDVYGKDGWELFSLQCAPNGELNSKDEYLYTFTVSMKRKII